MFCSNELKAANDLFGLETIRYSSLKTAFRAQMLQRTNETSCILRLHCSPSRLHHATPRDNLFCSGRKCDHRVPRLWCAEAHCQLDAICVAAAAGPKPTERWPTQHNWYADTGLGKLHLWSIQPARGQYYNCRVHRAPSRWIAPSCMYIPVGRRVGRTSVDRSANTRYRNRSRFRITVPNRFQDHVYFLPEELLEFCMALRWASFFQGFVQCSQTIFSFSILLFPWTFHLYLLFVCWFILLFCLHQETAISTGTSVGSPHQTGPGGLAVEV